MAVPSASVLPALRVPPLTVLVPLYQFWLARVRVPVPTLLSPPWLLAEIWLVKEMLCDPESMEMAEVLLPNRSE